MRVVALKESVVRTASRRVVMRVGKDYEVPADLAWQLIREGKAYAARSKNMGNAPDNKMLRCAPDDK